MRPVIGLIPLWDDEKDSLWMLPGYMEGIIEAGGLPLMLPLTTDETLLEEACSLCDGFLLTGGHDVSPGLYGEEKRPLCGRPCDERDAMESIVLKHALRQDKAVLGICRGIQLLNALMGGTLYQDLPSEHPSACEHHMSPPKEAACHQVAVLPGTPLHHLLGCESLPVNSYHHQAVKELASPLKAMAVSEDGLTEAVWMPGRHFVWAVQWHPEFAFRVREDCRSILHAFVNAAVSEG